MADTMVTAETSLNRRAPARRFLALAISLGALVLLGFYTISDPARLAGHELLSHADYAGYAVCHRITERTFTIAGRQMPLCARCTGIYLGIMVVFATLGVAGRWRWTELPRRSILIALIALIALMGVDGLNSYSHFFPNFPHVYEPQNWLRLVTGMGTGVAMGLFVFPALAQTLFYHQTVRPVLTSWREFGGVLALAALVTLLVLSNQPAILYVLGIVSALGVVIILGSINCVLFLIFLRRDARGVSLLEIGAPLLLGVGLAVGEIALIAVLRYSFTGTLTGFPGL